MLSDAFPSQTIVKNRLTLPASLSSMGKKICWLSNSGYFVNKIIILIRPTAPFLTQRAASCLRSASLVQCAVPPQTIDGKMAMEDGDMDADMDMLSDEELERYCEYSLCCQRLEYS